MSIEGSICEEFDNAKKIEIVHSALQRAKDTIALVYKPNSSKFCNPIKDITDEKIQEYYYSLNDMCIELIERNVMMWQKEDNEN